MLLRKAALDGSSCCPFALCLREKVQRKRLLVVWPGAYV